MADPLPLKLNALAWGANDPELVGRFWAAALRWHAEDVDEDGFVVLTPTDGTPFGIEIAPIPEPRVGPNQIHLDLTTSSLDDQRDTVAELLALGGRHLDIGQRPEEGHVVLADPEGNELCVIGPDNRFLAGCPRLGCVNGDGTRALGLFWSEVLGWPLIWDQDEETAIRAPDGTGPILSWGGPPVAPKLGKNRIHLDVAPQAGVDQQDAVDALVALGARPIDVGQGPDASWVVLADPHGNELCVLSSR